MKKTIGNLLFYQNKNPSEVPEHSRLHQATFNHIHSFIHSSCDIFRYRH